MNASRSSPDVGCGFALATAAAAVRTACSPLPLDAPPDGAPLLALNFFCAVFATSVTLVRLRARDAGTGAAAAGAMLTAALLATDATGRMTAPQWALCALVMLALDDVSSLRRTLTTVSAIAVWACLSPFAVVGALLVTISLLGPREGRAEKGSVLTAVAAWIALLAMPDGAGIVPTAIAALDIGREARAVLPGSLASAAPASSYGAFLVVVLLLACRRDEPALRPARDLLLAVTALGLAVLNGALLPIAGIVAVPVAVLHAGGGAVPADAGFGRSARVRIVSLGVVAGAVLLAAGSAVPIEAAHRAAQAPIAVLARRMERIHPLGRTLCLPAASCVVLGRFTHDPSFAMLLDPQRPARSALATAQAVATTNQWRTALRAAGIETLVFTRDRPLADLVQRDRSEWRLLGTAADYAAYERVHS